MRPLQAIRSSKAVWIVPLLLGALLTLAACRTDGDDSAEQSALDEVAVVGTGEIGTLLGLLEKAGVPYAVPEIAILREWADRAGTLVRLEAPSGQFELYAFDTADGLDAFLTQARGGAVRDLPANAAGWTFGRVLVLVPGAAEQSEVTSLLVGVLASDPFPLDPDAVIVDSGTDDDGAGPDGMGGSPMPPSLVAGTDSAVTRAELGTYCWSGAEVGICADSIGIISGTGRLAITSGEPVTLSGDLASVAITSATAQAWLLSEVELIEAEDDFKAWRPQGTAFSIPVVVEENGLVLMPGLPTGDYLVSIRILADQGDAQYRILLEVDGGTEGGGGGETTGGPSTPDSGIVLAAFGDPFRLGRGYVANVGGQVSVVLRGVQADNRCPSDVTCVTAGAASVLVEMVDGEAASMTVVEVSPGGVTAFSSLGFDAAVLAVDPEAHSERVILPSEYVVTLVVTAPAGSNGGSGSGGETGGGGSSEPDLGYRQVNALAPIEDVQVSIAESFPLQVFVTVSSGLPGGCAHFDRIDVERVGTQVNLTVWNLVPAPDEPIACTAIYGVAENTVALGSEFESGVDYQLLVNGAVAPPFRP